MHQLKRSIALGVCTALLPVALSAAPTEGEREFSLSGTGSSDKDFDNSNFGISGDLGWYLSPELSVGVRQSLNFADIEGQGVKDDYWNGSTRGYANYHFGSGAARPFVGASLGAIYGDGVNDTGVGGLELGMKYYVLESTYIMGRAEYQFFFESGDGAQENFDDGAWAYTLGVGFNF